MSSDFEKALARAAAERNAQDAAKSQQERELAEKLMLARAIINPYLAELGPKVVKVLRDLGVPTKRQYPRNGPAGGIDLQYWEFMCATESDSGSDYVRIYDSGEFLPETYQNIGIIENGQFKFLTGYNNGNAHMIASFDDKKVYVSRSLLHYTFSFDLAKMQELGEFLAQYIYSHMKE